MVRQMKQIIYNQNKRFIKQLIDNATEDAKTLNQFVIIDEYKLSVYIRHKDQQAYCIDVDKGVLYTDEQGFTSFIKTYSQKLAKELLRTFPTKNVYHYFLQVQLEACRQPSYEQAILTRRFKNHFVTRLPMNKSQTMTGIQQDKKLGDCAFNANIYDEALIHYNNAHRRLYNYLNIESQVTSNQKSMLNNIYINCCKIFIDQKKYNMVLYTFKKSVKINPNCNEMKQLYNKAKRYMSIDANDNVATKNFFNSDDNSMRTGLNELILELINVKNILNISSKYSVLFQKLFIDVGINTLIFTQLFPNPASLASDIIDFHYCDPINTIKTIRIQNISKVIWNSLTAISLIKLPTVMLYI